MVEDKKKNFLVKEYKKNPKSILLARNIIEKVTFDLMITNNLTMVDVDKEIVLCAKDYLWSYLLLPRDAIHLATAYKYRIGSIITTNPDFKNTSKDFDVYLP